MSLTVNASGTQTATVNTEHSLATSTTSGTYVFVADTVNLANGETVELRVYSKVLSGSTKHLAYYAVYTHAQGSPNKYSVPIPCTHYCEVTLKQTSGTGRSYDWELLQVDT